MNFLDKDFFPYSHIKDKTWLDNSNTLLSYSLSTYLLYILTNVGVNYSKNSYDLLGNRVLSSDNVLLFVVSLFF